MDYFDFKGKTAIVFGASSGIGAATAIGYAEHGANVAIAARRLEKLDDVKKQIEDLGVEALAVKCDVTSEEDMANAVKAVMDKWGRVDIVFNCAGVALQGGADDISTEDWDFAMNTNVRSIVFAARNVVPIMKKQGYGKIVNTASINAVLYDKLESFTRHSYNASKAAVVGLSGAMGTTYAKHGIGVNCIGPGLFETEMTVDTLMASEQFMTAYNTVNPTSRPGKMDEIVGTVLFLSSPASDYLVGEYIKVDGGMSKV